SIVLLVAWTAACADRRSADAVPGKDTARRVAAVDSPYVAPAARGSPTPADSAKVAVRRRVLIVGTSLTAGLGLDPADAYPAVLQRMADSAGYHVEIVNDGLSGETSAGALRRIDWLLAEPAAIVVLETGANDGLRGLDVDSTAKNIRDIFSRI